MPLATILTCLEYKYTMKAKVTSNKGLLQLLVIRQFDKIVYMAQSVLKIGFVLQKKEWFLTMLAQMGAETTPLSL